MNAPVRTKALADLSRPSAKRVLVADAHPLMRAALCKVLHGIDSQIETLEAYDSHSLNQVLENNSALDLILSDLVILDVTGLSSLIGLRKKYPDIPVVIVSANEDYAMIRGARESGASGFISKSSNVENVRDAIQDVLHEPTCKFGHKAHFAKIEKCIPDPQQAFKSLTPQQARVLTMVSKGLLNKQIAYALSVQEATIKKHMQVILQKFGVQTRTQVVIAAARILQNEQPLDPQPANNIDGLSDKKSACSASDDHEIATSVFYGPTSGTKGNGTTILSR
jgi:DNA-binding NarL/FixJ family response regulator